MSYTFNKDELDLLVVASRDAAEKAISSAAEFQRQLLNRGHRDLARQFNSVFYSTYRAGCLVSREIAYRALST